MGCVQCSRRMVCTRRIVWLLYGACQQPVFIRRATRAVGPSRRIVSSLPYCSVLWRTGGQLAADRGFLSDSGLSLGQADYSSLQGRQPFPSLRTAIARRIGLLNTMVFTHIPAE